MIKVYVSHSIRGPNGGDATKEDMDYNCDRIKLLVNRVRKIFPDVEFYVPAESEEFVGIAYRNGIVNEKQILDIDCIILDGCDLVVVFLPEDDPDLQGGREIEGTHAYTNGIPCLEVSSFTDFVTQLNEFLGLN